MGEESQSILITNTMSEKLPSLDDFTQSELPSVEEFLKEEETEELPSVEEFEEEEVRRRYDYY